MLYSFLTFYIQSISKSCWIFLQTVFRLCLSLAPFTATISYLDHCDYLLTVLPVSAPALLCAVYSRHGHQNDPFKTKPGQWEKAFGKDPPLPPPTILRSAIITISLISSFHFCYHHFSSFHQVFMRTCYVPGVILGAWNTEVLVFIISVTLTFKKSLCSNFSGIGGK